MFKYDYKCKMAYKMTQSKKNQLNIIFFKLHYAFEINLTKT